MRKNAFCIGIATTLVLCSAAGYALYTYIFPQTNGFNKRRWLLFDRGKYIAYFKSHPSALVGKTKAEIIEMLGPTAYCYGQGLIKFATVSSKNESSVLANYYATLLVYGNPLGPSEAVGIIFDNSGPNAHVIEVRDGIQATIEYEFRASRQKAVSK